MGGFNGKKAAPFVKGGGRSKAHPNDAKGRKRKKALRALARAKGADLAVGVSGNEIDLDWSQWNANHKGKGNQGTRQVQKTGKQTGVSFKEIKAFKASVKGTSKTGTLGPVAMAALERRSKMPGHFRAKAILAAEQGDTKGAAKFQALHVAAAAKRRVASKPQSAAPAPRRASTSTPSVRSAPRPPATGPKPGIPARKPKSKSKSSVPRQFRSRALNTASHAAAVRKDVGLSTPGADTDLAFRYKHGWIKIGAENAAPKMKDWDKGHTVGYADGLLNKRAFAGDGKTAHYLDGYERGYTKGHNTPASERLSAKRQMAADMRRAYANSGKPTPLRNIRHRDPITAAAPKPPATKVPKKKSMSQRYADATRQGPLGFGDNTGYPSTPKAKKSGPSMSQRYAAATRQGPLGFGDNTGYPAAKPKAKKKSRLKAYAKDVLARAKSGSPVITMW